MGITFDGMYNIAISQIELRMQRVFVALMFFKQFHLIRLSNPTRQYTSHTFHCRLAQLVRFAPVVIYSPKKIFDNIIRKKIISAYI